MKTLEEIRHRITNAKAEARALVDAADQTRGLEGDSLDRFDTLTAELTELRTEEAKIVARQAELAALVEAGSVEKSWGGHVDTEARKPVSNPLKGAQSLTRDQSFADWNRANGVVPEQQSELSFDRLVRGYFTGDWRGAEQERALATTTSSGLLVPAIVASTVLDLARNKSRVVEAGARTVPMTSTTLTLPRLTGDPGPGWRAEAGAIAGNDLSFDGVVLTARSLARKLTLSRELLADSEYVGTAIAEAFAASFAAEIDRTALLGTGVAPHPVGLANQAGVPVLNHSANGASIQWDDIINAQGAVLAANYNPNATIIAPRSATSLALRKDTAGNFLVAPAHLPLLTTGAIPINGTTGTSSDTSMAFTGQWDQYAIGIRESFHLEFLHEIAADTGQVVAIAHFRGDMIALQPTAFVVDKGLRG